MRRVLAFALLTFMAAGCSPPSADDLVRQVMEQRNNYTATLQSWTQREDGSLYLDVLVVNNNAEGTLRTLTVMVDQYDADSEVIDSRRVVLNVANLTPGLGESVGVTLPGAAAQVEGAALRIEPRPEEGVWDQFPEFDAVRPRV